MQLSPYFEKLAAKKRLCWRCLGGHLHIEPSQHPDYAFERCDSCDYWDVLEAPEGERLKPPELSPYFSALARQGRICPECHAAPLTIEPAPLTWDVAFEQCECGYMQAITAPQRACLGARLGIPKGRLQTIADELNRGVSGRRQGNVISFEEIRRSRDGR